jgi:hypothetical protein
MTLLRYPSEKTSSLRINEPGNVYLGQGLGGVGLSASLSLPRLVTPIIVDRVGNFNPRLRRKQFLMNTIVLDIYLLP